MISLFALVLALATLYVLSGIFIKKLFVVLRWLGRSRERAALFLGVIFLPGTFIHEISHFLMALVLLVPVGKLNLMPELEDNGIRMGSVAIGKTDFIRGSFVGLAPILVGGGVLFWVINFALSSHFNSWIAALFVYIMFQVTHTMFSSKRDLYAILELVVFTIIVSITLVYLKIYWPFIFIYQKMAEMDAFIQKLSYYLFIPIGLEIVFLWLFRSVREY